MATQAAEVRNNRVVVLVSEAEKRRIASNARAADMSVSDFMRRAAERYTEPTDAEQALMRDLLAQLEQANISTRAALENLEETESRAASFDEAAYRAEIVRQLEGQDINWAEVAERLGLAKGRA